MSIFITLAMRPATVPNSSDMKMKRLLGVAAILLLLAGCHAKVPAISGDDAQPGESGKVQGSSVSSTTSTDVVDEIVLDDEPVSSVITAIDLETGEVVTVTNPNRTSAGSTTVSNSSDDLSVENPTDKTQTTRPVSSSNTVATAGTTRATDPNRDYMDGYLPWK